MNLRWWIKRFSSEFSFKAQYLEISFTDVWAFYHSVVSPAWNYFDLVFNIIQLLHSESLPSSQRLKNTWLKSSKADPCVVFPFNSTKLHIPINVLPSSSRAQRPNFYLSFLPLKTPELQIWLYELCVFFWTGVFIQSLKENSKSESSKHKTMIWKSLMRAAGSCRSQ